MSRDKKKKWRTAKEVRASQQRNLPPAHRVHGAAPAPVLAALADLPCVRFHERRRVIARRAILVEHPLHGEILIRVAAKTGRVQAGDALLGGGLRAVLRSDAALRARRARVRHERGLAW